MNDLLDAIDAAREALSRIRNAKMPKAIKATVGLVCTLWDEGLETLQELIEAADDSGIDEDDDTEIEREN
jgi:hypothetical protein